MLDDPDIEKWLKVGGLIAGCFAAGFGAHKALTSAIVQRLRDDKVRLKEELGPLKDLPDRASKLEADKSGLERKRDELAQENVRLAAALDAAMGGATNPSSQVIEGLKGRLASYDKFRDALMGTEDELWKLREVLAPTDFAHRMADSKVKVITVANLKGGVGKTTLTANLMAYFAIKQGKRVLAIDFDYQGSLTRMVMLGANLQLGTSILSDTLLGGSADGSWLVQSSKDLGSTLPRCRFITCGQIFDRFENRTQLQWLLGETSDDVRFRLANILLQPAVQNEFDLVLIDAPPRLSLGAVNALCASHAIIVPTVLDNLSAETVGRFLGRASNAFGALNPGLVHAGVVGTITAAAKRNAHEDEAFALAQRGLAQWHGKRHFFEKNIPHINALARAAGTEIGYLSREKRTVRPIFDILGAEIVEKFELWPSA